MIEDGIILKGTQIVVPAKKHKAVLKLIMNSMRNWFSIVNFV